VKFCRRTPRHTTHLKDLPEHVRITRRQHPFDGKELVVFGRRRYQGKPHLVLILPDGSRSLIPTEWTDLDSSTPGSLALPKQNNPLGFVKDLLHARAVVDALLHRRGTSDGKGEKSVPEENNHLATNSELPRHQHAKSGCGSVRNICLFRCTPGRGAVPRYLSSASLDRPHLHRHL